MWHGRPRRDERARYRIYRAGAYARRIETAGHATSSSQAIKTGLWPATNPVPDQFDVFSSSLCGNVKPLWDTGPADSQGTRTIWGNAPSPRKRQRGERNEEAMIATRQGRRKKKTKRAKQQGGGGD